MEIVQGDISTILGNCLKRGEGLGKRSGITPRVLAWITPNCASFFHSSFIHSSRDTSGVTDSRWQTCMEMNIVWDALTSLWWRDLPRAWCLEGNWEGRVANQGHLEIRRDPWTKGTHFGFDNRVRVMKTICMDTVTWGGGENEVRREPRLEP